ncbi:LysR family transcriptional regulator [Pseudomonas sp. J452]|uniref:LysR family transcriptional regulator n=1 Tax=Pseudomonas sp. J452 TaxID=2898441 RepID=UPI0021ADA68A|nr:LysR family transcriptional regulator [Pseudomonas sp. J452]UUY08668.1 LysR family transcriptional regulator [Pseudomonas sp. J452]
MNRSNHSSNLNRLDLNLFRVFAVIFRERNLTRAAEQLCISQSAVSHALARMRQQLNDPLFIREAQGVVPTPAALRIWPDVQAGLELFQRVANNGESFEPARDVTRITVAIIDEAEPALLPTLSAALRSQVPGVQLASVRIDRSTLKSDLATGRVDCAIDVAQAADDELLHLPLTRDDFVVVSRTATTIDATTYMAAQHITVSSRRAGRSFEDWELSRLGITRQVAARCQHYETAYRLVANSDLLLSMPRSLAVTLNAHSDNHIHLLPVPVPAVELHLFWHREREKDVANIWLRELLLGVIQS